MRVFISYSSKDIDKVKNLETILLDTDSEVWYDKNLVGGEPWWDKILLRIRECDVFLFVVSPHSVKSIPCLRECNYAIDLRKNILPVLVSNNVDLKSISPDIQKIQFVRYLDESWHSMRSLYLSLSKIPDPLPLPVPLPKPPDAPITAKNIRTDLNDDDIDELIIELRTGMNPSGIQKTNEWLRKHAKFHEN